MPGHRGSELSGKSRQGEVWEGNYWLTRKIQNKYNATQSTMNMPWSGVVRSWSFEKIRVQALALILVGWEN